MNRYSRLLVVSMAKSGYYLMILDFIGSKLCENINSSLSRHLVVQINNENARTMCEICSIKTPYDIV